MAASRAAYVLLGVLASLLAVSAYGDSSEGCCSITKGSGPAKCSGKRDECGNGFVAGGICNVNTGMCTTTGGMKSDPIFTGFDNSTFEFFGTSGFNYSVLTSKAVTVNMGLVEAGPLHIRHQQGQGTFVGSLAVLLPSSELVVQVSEAGNMTFTVDGIAVDMTAPGAWGVVKYEPFRPDVGQVVTISTSSFRFTIVAVKQFTDETSGYNRGHLDLSVAMTGHADSTVAGVLGQTLYASPNADESSFEIPSLTYQPGITTEVAFSSARRLLALEGRFPRHAGFSAMVTNINA